MALDDGHLGLITLHCPDCPQFSPNSINDLTNMTHVQWTDDYVHRNLPHCWLRDAVFDRCKHLSLNVTAIANPTKLNAKHHWRGGQPPLTKWLTDMIGSDLPYQ